MAESGAKSGRTISRGADGGGFADPAVAAVFAAYPKRTQARLLAPRQLILETAAETPGVGPLDETLKWGQPSYLTSRTRSGSTIRIDRVKPGATGDPKAAKTALRHCIALALTYHRNGSKDQL